MKKKHKKVSYYKKPFHLNIAVIIFGFVLIYFLVYFFQFLTSKHVSIYEVQKGQIMETSVYTGLILCEEEVTYSEESGQINYYSKEGDKAGYNDLICSIDREGSVAEEITAAGLDGSSLTKEELLDIQSTVVDYISNYSDTQFYNVYSFKSNLNSDVQESLYLATLEELTEETDSGTFSLIRAKTDGILAFYTDGYEDITIDNFSAELYQPSSYQKNNLKSNSSVSSGQALYKTVTDENWYVMIPLDEEEITYYREMMGEDADSFVIQVTLKKDGAQAYATASLRTYDSGSFLQLAFNSSMIRYISDRYIEVELGDDDQTGLKIPNSAIVQKEFLLIPADYISQGDNSSSQGVIRISSGESDGETAEFVSTDIYYTDEETGYCYVPADDLAQGDVIQKPDSADQYVISDTGTLDGVYNVNKGYAVFKKIEILTSNGEYTIVKTGTSYGLSLYDRIALDGTSISEGGFVN